MKETIYMMIIDIKYDSCWRNSFLDGSNNEPISKKNDRKFIATSKSLKENFKECSVTQDTVIGILNRLIGDQRKLYLSRTDKDYYFKDLEDNFTDKVKFNDDIDIKVSQQEVVYLRNMNVSSYDQNSFCGIIRTDHELFNSDYSQYLWSIWFYKFDDLIKFILDKDYKVDFELLDLASIQSKLDELKKSKIKIDKSDTNTKKALKIIRNKYYDEKGALPKKFSFYAYAFYEQIKRLKSKGYNVFTEKKDNISGISANSFTLRDFSKYFANKKLVYGAPYKLDDKALTKATGKLTIELDISDDQAQDLQQKILDAGVSPFYLGKKGVAYVKDIRVNGTSIYDDY